MKRLVKSKNRVLFGVCGGIAEYARVNPVVVRLLMILLTVFHVLPGILAYAGAASVMPDESWDSDSRNASGGEEPCRNSECSAGASGAEQGTPRSDAEFDSFFKKGRDGHGTQDGGK